MLKDVGDLEILQAPGLPYIIPKEYGNLTHLTGAHCCENGNCETPFRNYEGMQCLRWTDVPTPRM